jgi:thioredoxin reductase (NADPH)
MAEQKDLFPKLDDEQIKMLSQMGKIRKVKEGEHLINVNERNHDFFVVLEGAIGILNDAGDEITVHLPGEFTGNSDSLSERTAVFSAVANCNSVVVQLSQAQLKESIATDQDLSEILLRAFLLRRANELEQNIGTVKLVGSRYSPETFKLREFLSKNHVQHTWTDLEKDETSESILAQFHVSAEETPILIVNQEKIYKNPSLEEIAEVLGLSSYFKESIFDVIIVGAGPAGLAASVYAASEGLNVVTIDSIGPGGQAGSSSRIENYLGFPMGISGSELANNAYIQAQKFGCVISIPHSASSLQFKNNYFHLELESGTVIKGSTVIAATGARYRKLKVDKLEQFEGRGIYYGATQMEATLVAGKEIVIVGGGNSAGQAAIFLSHKTSRVHMVIRGDGLSNSMSSYLISRIMNNPSIEVHTNTEVKMLCGETRLEEVVVEKITEGKKTSFKVAGLFLFLGAVPCSDWLSDTVCLDEKGFVYTGKDIPEEAFSTYHWPLERKPESLETCIPGLFAVGDVRYGSVKRVASAVGEGSMAVSQVHNFLSMGRTY